MILICESYVAKMPVYSLNRTCFLIIRYRFQIIIIYNIHNKCIFLKLHVFSGGWVKMFEKLSNIDLYVRLYILTGILNFI